VPAQDHPPLVHPAWDGAIPRAKSGPPAVEGYGAAISRSFLRRNRLQLGRFLYLLFLQKRWANREKVGQLRIYGTVEFMSRCGSALQRIEQSDKTLYQNIQAESWIISQHDRDQIFWGQRLCFIDEALLSPSWQVWGVLAKIIYSHLCRCEYLKCSLQEAKGTETLGRCMQAAAEWCGAHGCPHHIWTHISFHALFDYPSEKKHADIRSDRVSALRRATRFSVQRNST
jgi:hypothetical protein